MDFSRTRGTDWLTALGGARLVITLAAPWYTVGGVGIGGSDAREGVVTTLLALAGLILLVLPTAIAAATPRVRRGFLLIAVAASAVAVVLTIFSLFAVPDLDLYDFRARSISLGGDPTPSGRTGTSREWGVLISFVIAALTAAVAAASLNARRGRPAPPPPPS